MKLLASVLAPTTLASCMFPSGAAQGKCLDDCDLEFRECLRLAYCHLEYMPCDNAQKAVCEDSFGLCKFECPCGERRVKSITRSPCQDGCPCPNYASKEEYCHYHKQEMLLFNPNSQWTTPILFKWEEWPDQHKSSIADVKLTSYPESFESGISRMCSFQIRGNMYLIGGYNNTGLERRNFQIKKQGSNYYVAQLPDLPLGFSDGRCVAYSESRAMICASEAYQTNELWGRECFDFDEDSSAVQKYTFAGYTNFSHYQGAMVAWSIFGAEPVPMIIGGQVPIGDPAPSGMIETYQGNSQWKVFLGYEQITNLVKFSAVTFDYRHFFGQQQMIIFGGMFEPRNGQSTPNENVWLMNGNNSLWKTTKKMAKARHQLLSMYKDGKIYHIGGNSEIVEIWDMKFDFDPGYVDGQTSPTCPTWCWWYPETGGQCSLQGSIDVGMGDCYYGYDEAQFDIHESDFVMNQRPGNLPPDGVNTAFFL